MLHPLSDIVGITIQTGGDGKAAKMPVKNGEEVKVLHYIQEGEKPYAPDGW